MHIIQVRRQSNQVRYHPYNCRMCSLTVENVLYIMQVRRQSNQVRWLMRTPLLEQRPKKTNVIAVSIAALIGLSLSDPRLH